MFSKDYFPKGIILLISTSVLLILLVVLSILFPAKPSLSGIIPLEDEITFDLQPGWNLISIPFMPKTIIGETMMYSDLFELINQNGGGCQSILPYNPEENQWKPIYKHDPFTEPYNDELKAGHGYAIKCNGNVQIVLRGLLCKSEAFHFGSNRFYFIGPVGDKSYTAKGLSDELGLGTGSVIIPSNMEKQFRPDFPIFDFNLERGRGYFIKCATDKTWWYVESEGQPLYSDSQGIYIWQGSDGLWYIHLDSEAVLLDNDMVNNVPINDLLISDPYHQDGAIIDIAAPRLSFLFPAVPPQNIHVGLWGSSPDSSSFDLYNEIPSENVVQVILSNPNPKVNETFTADIVITNAQDVYSLNFHLRFDSDILTANQVTNGDFFTQSDIEFEHYIRNNDGEIIVGFTRKGEVPGISFSQTTKRLLSIEFVATDQGESLFGFEKECLFDSEDSQQKARWFGSKVKCDILPLDIQIISPRENIVTNYPYMEVRVCTNTDAGVMVNGIKADPTPKILGEGGCNFIFAARQIKLKPGKNHILATGSEIDANDSIQIYYKGCDFAITSHQDGEIINNPNITISGTTDHLDDAVITAFNRSIDTQDNPPAEAIINPNASDCEFSAKGISLREGENRIIVTKTEHSGSFEEREITIYLDTLSPIITITSPRDQSDITFDTITDFKRYGILSNLVITNDGRILLKKEDNRVFRPPYLLHSDNLNERKIKAMGVDPRNGDIWFSTESKKIYVISGSNRSEISNPITMFDDKGLPIEINVIAIDNGGFKWLGTNKGVLLNDNKDWYRYTIEDEGSEAVTRAYKLSKTSQDWENIRNDYFHLPNNHIQCIYFRFEGIKWNYYFGTYDGLTIYDGYGYNGSYLNDGNNHSQIITSEDVGLNEGQSLDILDIAADDKGQLWFATCCGLLRYDTFMGWTIVDDEEVIDKKITALAFDKDTGLWIGTEETGIYSLDQDFNYNNYNTNKGLSSDHVNDIAIDATGIIWIATPLGVNYYENSQWNRLSVSIEGNDYTSVAYNTLSIDKEDNLWLGASSNGLIEYFRPYYSGPSAYIDIFYHVPSIFDYHSIQWEPQASPDLTNIDVQIKSALTKEGLNNENFIDCTQNPFDLSSLVNNPWVQIRATLSTNERELTPELDAIIIRYLDKVIVSEDRINVSGFIKDSAPVSVMVNENEARIFMPEMDISTDAIIWLFTATDINLTEGENIIKIEASDRAGNWDLEYLYVMYESEALSNVSIDITSPVEGALITDTRSVSVEGAVTGNNVRAFINDSEVQIADGKFHTMLPLAPENPRIKALAIDSAGYHASSEIMLHILEVTSPKHGQIVNNKNLLIQGATSWDSDVEIAVSQNDISLDDIAGLGLLNYAEVDPLDNRFSVHKTLKPGKNLVYVRQYFTSDYRCLKSEVILDGTSPLILIDRTQFKDLIETWRVSEIISQDNIRAIEMVQEDDSIWIGTYGAGVKRYASLPAGTPIGHYDTNNSLLPNDYIMDIHINDSYIWIATYGGGICRIRKEDDAWDVYDAGNQLASLYVTCIAEDSDGMMWFGTSGGGISSYSPHYGWEIIKNSFNEDRNRIEGPLPNNYIYCITVDRWNNKWIGASDGKMGTLKADNDTWEYFDLAPKRIWDTYVTSIEIDPNDRKWISLSGGGLAMINKGNDQVFIYLTPENLHIATNEDFHPADHISTSVLNIGGNVFYSDPMAVLMTSLTMSSGLP